jgi:hypothetical protein
MNCIIIKFIGNEKLIPQSEEDITEIKWVTKNEAVELIPSMYASVEEMINSYFIGGTKI